MELKTKRIIKETINLSAKFLAIGVVAFVAIFVFVSVSMWLTDGSTWPVFVLLSLIFPSYMTYEIARYRVESQIRDEEDMIKTLSKKYGVK